MPIDYFLFCLGGMLGIVPPFLWGKIGGDEPIIEQHPELTTLLKLIHHWWIGAIIVFIGLVVVYPFQIVVYGWGLTTFLDDAMFHSFESYFERIKK